MRRPSPAPAPPPAPPPRQAGTPGHPPRRAPAPGGAVPPRRSAPPSNARPGPRPAPPRPPGPPRRRRRGPVLIAALLTVVILVGYGGYSAWNAVTGGDSGGGDAPAAGGYEAIVSQDIFLAGLVVGQGVDVRLVGDLNGFRDNANRAIFIIGSDKGALAKLATGATGPQRDVISDTQLALDALQAGLIQWRDAVYNVRLAAVDDAHSAIDSAVARLSADLDQWKALPPAP